jgi:phage baseplate assembly protein V
MNHLAALRSNMAAMAQMAAQGFVASAIGLVSSYDQDHYLVKVTLQPPPDEGDTPETGWLPIWSGWVGDGWGLFCPPVIGAQVTVHFIAGDGQVGLCIGALYSDADRPLSVPSGEFWVVHKSGAFFKLTNDGAITMQADADTFVTLAPGGAITSKGAWSHTGSITATGEGTFNGGHTVSQHEHPGVQSGSSNTAKPTG